MKAVIPMDVAGGGVVYIETDSIELIEPTSRADVETRVERVFADAMDTIKTVAAGVSTTMKSVQEQLHPSAYNVEFGVSLSSEVGAVVARAAANATIKVSITWIMDKEVSVEVGP